MKSSIFVFVGVPQENSDADIEILKSRLQENFNNVYNNLTFTLKNDLLTLAFTKPDYRFYVSFVKEEVLTDYVKLAKDCELPWDKKPIDTERVKKIFSRIEKKNWANYQTNPDVGNAILSEMQKFKEVEIYCIPSFGRFTIF